MEKVVRAIVRIPAQLIIGVVRVYQLVISPHLAPSCRYVPTCSEYAIQALRQYGLFKGIVLAANRITRCHPWGGSGYDPPRWFNETPENESPLQDLHEDNPAGGDPPLDEPHIAH